MPKPVKKTYYWIVAHKDSIKPDMNGSTVLFLTKEALLSSNYTKYYQKDEWLKPRKICVEFVEEP